MKRILIILCLIWSVAASAQIPGFTKLNNYYEDLGIVGDSTLGVPYGTAARLAGRSPARSGLLWWSTSDSSLYGYTGTQWLKIGDVSGFGFITQSDLDDTAAAIRGDFPDVSGKLNISDTATMLAGYTLLSVFLDSLDAVRGDFPVLTTPTWQEVLATESPFSILTQSNTIVTSGYELIISGALDINQSDPTQTSSELFASNGSVVSSVRPYISGGGTDSQVDLNATNGSEISNIHLTGDTTPFIAYTSSSHIFNGLMRFSNYGSGTITGTPTYTLSVDASGNVIETDTVAAATTYTFQNGLNESTGTVKLGGDLTENTVIGLAETETHSLAINVSNLYLNSTTGDIGLASAADLALSVTGDFTIVGLPGGGDLSTDSVLVISGNIVKKIDLSGIGAGGGATPELDNLTTTAINADLIPDTDNAYDLGSASKQWKDLYMTGASIYMAGAKILSTAGLTLPTGGALRTSTTNTNTALLQAYDVDGAAYTTFATLTAGNTPTMDLAAGVTLGGNPILTSTSAGSTYVPLTTTVNGHALSSNVTVTPTDLSLVIGTNTEAWDADLDYLATFTPAANVKSILNAADYAAMKTLLALTIGTNVQAYDADLTTYAGITPSANIQSLLGSADYSAARTNLGLAIGSNVQAYDADLTTYAGITPSANIQSLLGSADYSAARTNLGLAIGSNVQAYDADLDYLSGFTPSANVKTILNAADYAAVKTALSLTIGTNVQAYDADLTTYAGITPSANVQTLLGSADYAAFKTSLALTIGTNVQAYDADLTTWAGVTPGSNVGTFLATPSSANLRSALTDENGTGVALFNAATSPDFTTSVTIGSVAVPTISSTNTFTNKRITLRTGTTTSSATPTINTDNVDKYSLTAQTADITSFTTNLSGTPTEGQTLIIEVTGTASRAITWGASFEASQIALPTTTSSTSTLSVEFRYNTTSSKWRIKEFY